MTPAELRARAKSLRAEASACIREADDIETAEAHRRRVESSREALETRAAAMCRPVWRVARDGPWVVEGIDAGCFLLVQLGTGTAPTRYGCRTGHPTMDGYMRTGRPTPGVIDTGATMLAWREWCATRKAAP